MAHIKSRGAGGEDAMENTVWKCPYCHIFLEHTKGEKDKTMKPEIEDALREMAKDIPEEEWDKFQKYIIRSRGAKWHIGDRVKDEWGHIGVVSIVWNDGDICTREKDAAHCDPRLIEE